MKTDRDLGQLGESELERLCHHLGVSPNKAKYDKTGWDFLLEFPFNTQYEAPHDQAPITTRCLVQVKSTDLNEKNCQVKVSNLKRFLEFPDPAFFVFMHYNGKENVQEIYVVHFGRPLIEKTLKKLRKLSLKPLVKLHKTKISVRYSIKEIIEPANSVGLNVAIHKYIPKGMKEYRKWKDGLINTLGYEKYGHRMDITIEKKAIKKLEDISLSKEYEVDFFKMKVWDERFGIPILKYERNKDQTVLKFKHLPKKKYQACFKSGKQKIWFDIEVMTSVFSDINDSGKMKVSCALFDLYIYLKDYTLKFEPLLNNEDLLPLFQIQNLANLITILGTTNDVLFTIEGKKPFNLVIPSPSIVWGEDVNEFVNATQSLTEIFDRTHLPTSHTFSLKSIYSHRNQVLKIPNLQSTNHALFVFDFTSEQIIPKDKEYTIVIFLGVTIGLTKLGVLISASGNCIHQNEKTFRLNVNESQIHEAVLFNEQTVSTSIIEKFINDTENELKAENKSLIRFEEKSIMLIT
ncbi:hypothetical protein AWW67_14215 [Roseivirga seohaensis]|uniref:DUF4365 domain-containing protein n=1 Tax=Roseivirga seohaensis TaxID=1914963 RepID=A0A150Y3Q3_9BACT|nr:hypothetical protein [Roseivirga seohaensis]KYG85532.1 hypothetical protein AWW67_14215 [Roseivirga seohaensis]